MSKVKVKFLKNIIKNGKMRNPGDEMEIDAGAAARLAAKNVLEIPGYDVKKVTREVVVDEIVPKEASTK